MPANVLAISESNIKVRYREPYISAALNQKFQQVVPVGVYDGFIPSVVTANQIQFSVGPTGTSTAVVTSLLDSDYQVTVRLGATTSAIDLTAYAGSTVAVVIRASYDFPTVTSANFVAYNLSSESVPSDACVLCQVAVPAMGGISSGDISLKGRTFPWQQVGRDAKPFVEIVKNGSFVLGDNLNTDILRFWDVYQSVGTVAYDSATANPTGNLGGLVEFSASASATAQTSYIEQLCCVPVGKNNRVNISLTYVRTQAPTSGNPILEVDVVDATTQSVLDTILLPLVTSSAYASLSTTYEIAAASLATSPQAFISAVRIKMNSAQYGASGVAFRVGDVSVGVEQSGKSSNLLSAIGGEIMQTTLRLLDDADIISASIAETVTITYDSTANRVVLAATSGSVGLVVPGTLTIGTLSATSLSVSGTSTLTGLVTMTSGARTNSIDTLTVGATLSIGVSNASTITLGNGTQNIGLQGTVSSSGNFSVGASKLTVAAASGNTAIAGTLDAAGNFRVNTNKLTVDASTGNTLVAGTLTTSGATILGSSLSVTTTIASGGNLTVATNKFTVDASTGDASVFRDLSVGDDLTVTDDAAVGGDLTVTGTVTASSAVSTPSVSSLTTLQLSAVGTVSIVPGAGALTVYGNVVITNTLTLQTIDYSGGSLTIGANTTSLTLGRSGYNAIFSGGIYVNQTGQFVGSLTAPSLDANGAALTVGGGASSSLVLGKDAATTTINGSTTAIGTGVTAGAVTISRSGVTTTVAGHLTISGNTNTTAGILYADNIDNNVAAQMNVGYSNTTVLMLGSATNNVRVQSANFAVRSYSGGGSNYPYIPSSEFLFHTLTSGGEALTTSTASLKWGALSANNAQGGLTYDNATGLFSGFDDGTGLGNVGLYEVEVSFVGYTSAAASSPTYVTMQVSGTVTGGGGVQYRKNGAVIAANEPITLIHRTVVYDLAGGGNFGVYLTTNTGTATVVGDFHIKISRVKRRYNDT